MPNLLKPRDSGELRQNFGAILAFGLFSAFLAINHEPWRDEAQSWLISRDSHSLSNLFHWMGYEGTPALWHILIYPLTQLGLPYESMFLFHLLLSLLAAVLFLFYSPFPQAQKTLAVFGYFLLYEYTVIARSYVLVVILLFSIATVYQTRFSRPLTFATLIALLANTSVHGLVVSLALLFTFSLELQRRHRTRKQVFAAMIPLIGCIVAVLQVLPPIDLNPATAEWHLDFSPRNLGGIPHAVLGAFVPVPQLKTAFWNSRLIYSFTPIMALLGIPIFLYSLCHLAKKPIPLAIYSLSNTGLFAIIFLKDRGSLRHHGLIFILFLFCIWISHHYPDSRLRLKPLSRFTSSHFLSRTLTLFLSLHIMAAATASFFEIRYDFSASRKAAEFLAQTELDNPNTLVAAYPAYAAAPVLPFLTRIRQFYYLEYETFGSFLIWNKEYYQNRELTMRQIMKRVGRVPRGEKSELYLILNSRLDEHPQFMTKFELITHFDQTIVPEESLFIYRSKVSPEVEGDSNEVDVGENNGGNT